MAKSLDHPVPQRLFHWTNLISMAVLIVTGFYINKPFSDGIMNGMRYLHFFAMFVILSNVIARVYYAYFGKYSDAKYFSIGKKDGVDFINTVKYYLFIGPHKEAGKYNPLQKVTYITYVPLLLFQGFTGFIMYRPEAFDAAIKFMGGLASVRGYHYLFMWVFIAFSIVHIYMASIETMDQVKLMLFNVSDDAKESR